MMMMGRIWVEMMDDHGPPRVRRKPLVSCHSLAGTAPLPPPYCSTAAPRLAARWMSQVKPFWCSNLDCLTSNVRTRVEKTTPGLSVSKSGTSRCPSSAPWPRTAVMLSEVQLWLLATIGDIHKGIRCLGTFFRKKILNTIEGLILYLVFCHCHSHNQSHNAYQQCLPSSSVQSNMIKITVRAPL